MEKTKLLLSMIGWWSPMPNPVEGCLRWAKASLWHGQKSVWTVVPLTKQ